jgi:prevent-host-death family protein
MSAHDEVSVTQARSALAELVNRVRYGGERIMVTRHGRPLAALVPAEDLERLEELERLADLERRDAEEAPARAVSEFGLPPAQRAPAPGRFGVAARHDAAPGRR